MEAAKTDTTPGPLSRLVEREWQMILDKDDRNSPEEYPEMVLLTHNELAGAMCEAWLLAKTVADTTLAEQFAALRQRVADLGQARDVSIALTHLDTAEKWARDYGAQPAARS